MADFLYNTKGRLRENVDIAKTTWFQVGGKVKYLFRPENKEDLINFLINKKDLKVIPLGVCSNCIIRDGGINGAIIKLGRNFTNIEINKNEVTIGAGALDYNVAHFLAKNSLTGLEFYVGIPGSIGGAVAMNAGAYGNETSEFLVECEAIRISDGKYFKLTNKDLGFTYRSNSLEENFIFISAKYKLYSDSPENILRKMNIISAQREATQPIRSKTGGSTFKNPEGYKAWKLIDECGLRGFMMGSAQVSEKHCNFLINTSNAKASELEELGEYIINTVYKKKGIKLQWEIKRIGIK